MLVGRKKIMIRENYCCMYLPTFSVIKPNMPITGILLRRIFGSKRIRNNDIEKRISLSQHSFSLSHSLPLDLFDEKVKNRGF